MSDATFGDFSSNTHADRRRGGAMNKPVSLRALSGATAHPLRRASSAPLRNRAGAAIITILAHIVAITALVEGLRQANILHLPDVVTVHIEPRKQKPEEIQPLPMPRLVKPTAITAPIPMFTIGPPPPNTVAVSQPSPPTVSVALPVPKQAPSHAAVTWQGLLLARLQQAKRYPLSAQAHRQQGVTLLHFTMDREGRVLTANIQKSSGYDALDQESLALIQRAQPLPEPPAEVTGDPIELVVPVEFSLKYLR